jgi:hypothetical protein
VEGGKEGGYFSLILFFIVEWLGKGRGLIFLQIHNGRGRWWLKIAIFKILGTHGP